MRSDGLVGLLFVIGTILFLTTAILYARFDHKVKRLILAGLWLRVAGSLAYLYLIGSYYGRGDYHLYFSAGLDYADILWAGDMDDIVEPWAGRRWWGTWFVVRLTGMVLGILGPTLPGAFIVFAVASYAGLLAIWAAFTRSFPQADRTYYLGWLVFFPSLWFWPAALGKDALVLCGVGIATLGFVGRGQRSNWIVLGIGVFIVFCIRPQVAATLVFAIVTGHWIGVGRHWNLVRVLQGTVMIIGGVVVLALSSGSLGLELFNPEEVGDYMDTRVAGSTIGGSAIDAPGANTAVWLAPITTLFRPFPWESAGLTSHLAAAEVVVLWLLAWYRRRRIGAFFRTCRQTPLFWMAVVFILVYATALGMSVGNVGIIARQRVHILPFVLMFFAGTTKQRRLASRLPMPSVHQRSGFTR